MRRILAVAAATTLWMACPNPALAGSIVDLDSGVGFMQTSDGVEAAPGLALELGAGLRLGRHLRLGMLGTLGVLHPQRTVAVANAAVAAGTWTTEAFGSVHGWASRRTRSETWNGLKQPLALFAYTGLLTTYMAVPVLLAVSPLASLGQVGLGPMLRFDTGAAPDLYVEAGAQWFLYTLASGATGWGMGPALGIGTDIAEGLRLGGRLTVSPNQWTDQLAQRTGPVVTGAVVVGF